MSSEDRKDEKVRVLRVQYESAHAAWRSQARLITEAMMSDKMPSADLLASEISALEELKAARQAYREAAFDRGKAA